jgi:hypothetical protein
MQLVNNSERKRMYSDDICIRLTAFKSVRWPLRAGSTGLTKTSPFAISPSVFITLPLFIEHPAYGG